MRVEEIWELKQRTKFIKLIRQQAVQLDLVVNIINKFN